MRFQSMQVETLKRTVCLLYSSDGSYRGLIQVPFNIGVCLNLMHNGMTATHALASVIFWVIGMPRFFSFITEILGGVVAHRFGPIGSFKMLPIGYGLRTLAMIGFMLGCVIPNPTAILALCSLAVLIGEIGRSFNSGALEDSYQRTGEKISQQGKDLVAVCDVIGNMNLLWLRALTAAIGTFSILCAHFVGRFETLITCVPFLISIGVHCGATLAAWRWFLWANENISGERKTENCGSMWGQVRVFFQKKDYLWCIGIGGCLSFVWIYAINMAPLTMDSLLENLSLGTTTWLDVLSATLIAFAIPFANLLGVNAFFNYLLKGYSRQNIFRKLDSWMGIGIVLTWLLIAVIAIGLGPWGNATIFIASTLAFTLAPFNIWTGWMRIPLTEEAEANPEFRKQFGESRVFYFSLIEGSKETFFGVLAAVFSAAEGLISFSTFGLMLLIIGACSLAFWKNFRVPSLHKPLRSIRNQAA